jgi:hypothetical protein
MAKWIIQRDGTEHGPFSTDELKKMAADGKLSREDRIRPEGKQVWKSPSEIKGLLKLAPKVDLKFTGLPSNVDEDFDPYRKWLGIPADKRPPTLYQLLSISPSEEDRETIEAAADRQQNFVKQFRGSPYDEHAATILFQLEDARATLLDPEARLKYDRTLNLAHKKQRDNARGTTKVLFGSHPVGESSGVARQFAGVMAVIVAGFVVMWLVSSYLPGRNADNKPEVAQAEPQPAEQRPEQKADQKPVVPKKAGPKAQRELAPKQEVEPPPAIPENTVAWFLSKAEAELSDSLSERDRDGLLAEIAGVRASCGELEAARKAVTSINDTMAKDRLLSGIVTALAKRQSFETANETAQQIVALYIKAFALLTIAKEQSGSGDKAGARRTFENTRKMLRSLSDREMAAQRLKQIALSDAYGDKSEKLDAMADALSEARLILDKGQQGICLHQISTAYATMGEFRLAKSTAASIEPPRKQWALDAVAAEQLRIGDLDGARDSLKESHGTDGKKHLLIEFAIASAQNGDFTKAKSLVLQERDSFQKAMGFAALAEAHLSNKQDALACDSLAACVQNMDSVTQDNQQYEGFHRIIKVVVKLIKSNQVDQTDKWLEWAFHVREPQRADAMYFMCNAYMDTNRSTIAKRLLLDGRLGTAYVANHIARRLAKLEVSAHDKIEVPEWIATTSDRMERALAYLGCAEALADKEGEPKPARK